MTIDQIAEGWARYVKRRPMMFPVNKGTVPQYTMQIGSYEVDLLNLWTCLKEFASGAGIKNKERLYNKVVERLQKK